MDWLRARPFAHRGLHDSERPENSLAAVEAAAKDGYGIEVDVRLAADGQAVLSHDPPLGGEPLLTEALAAAAGASLLVELKEREAVPAAAAALRGYPGPFAFISFDALALRQAGRASPGAALGQLVGRPRQRFAALVSRPDFLLLETRLVRPHRLPVLAWTVRSAEADLAARAAGAANVVFEGYRPG